MCRQHQAWLSPFGDHIVQSSGEEIGPLDAEILPADPGSGRGYASHFPLVSLVIVSGHFTTDKRIEAATLPGNAQQKTRNYGKLHVIHLQFPATFDVWIRVERDLKAAMAR
jgi:hypothetical protein